MTEADILREVMAGNTELYGEIFTRHRSRAFKLAFQYTRNKEDALDIVQEAFVKAFQNLRRFDLNRQFAPWLLTIVRNLSLDFLRKKKADSIDDVAAGVPSLRTEGRMDARILKDQVWRALCCLEPQHREIIFLRDYLGHSYAEIAEILGIPMGTVMSRLHYARKTLAQVLLGEQ